MKAYVFTDKSLERYAGQFVWLTIDIEKSVNDDFLRKFPSEGVPTLFIIDPKTKKAAVRWLGSATVAQLTKLFEDGRKSVAGSRDLLAEGLAKADRLYGEGKNAEAAIAFEKLLKDAPANWSRRGRATESLLFALQSSEQFERCATTASSSFPGLKNTASAMNVVALGLDCALSMQKEIEGRAALVAELERAAIATMANEKVIVAADDRSGLYQVLISAREDAGDAAGQRRVTEEWATFLEQEAAKAKTVEGRVVFDSHRLSAYLALNEPERAIPMLQASRRDQPEDYNPPARLAVAYRAMKKYDLALESSTLALSKAYGPRKIGILRTRADIYLDMEKRDEARKTLEEALALAEGMPAGQRSERTIAALKEKLASLG